MELAGYVRVSTQDQADHGLGMDEQRARIETWCRDNGHTLLTIHEDAAISGYAEPDVRDGLLDALSDVSFNGAEGIVIANTGRLARDSFHQEWAMREIWKNGGKIFTVDSGEVLEDDPDRPMDAFVRKLFGLIDELEGRMIAQRLRRGRARAAAQGRFIGGTPPYGLKVEDKYLVPDEAEMAVVRRMRGLRDEGESIRGICRTLNEEGIPSKRGGKWYPQTVSDTLTYHD